MDTNHVQQFLFASIIDEEEAFAQAHNELVIENPIMKVKMETCRAKKLLDCVEVLEKKVIGKKTVREPSIIGTGVRTSLKAWTEEYSQKSDETRRMKADQRIEESRRILLRAVIAGWRLIQRDSHGVVQPFVREQEKNKRVAPRGKEKSDNPQDSDPKLIHPIRREKQEVDPKRALHPIRKQESEQSEQKRSTSDSRSPLLSARTPRSSCIVDDLSTTYGLTETEKRQMGLLRHGRSHNDSTSGL